MSAATPHGCPPAPRPPEPHIFPCLFVISIFPSRPAALGAPWPSPASLPGRPEGSGSSRPLPRPVSASLAQNFGRSLSPAASLRCPGVLPAAGLPPPPSRPHDLSTASAALGTGVEIKNQTPRRPQSGHPIPSYPIPSHPMPFLPACMERGRQRGVVSRGFSGGISLPGAPVPLLRAGPSKEEAAPRGSVCKCFQNRWRRRVCLKSGCGSTPGHFRLSSAPRYQSPGACDK